MSSTAFAASTPAAEADAPWRRVPYVNQPAQYAVEREAVLACVERVFSRGDFVGGEAIERLERALAEFIGVRFCVAVNSGTDALILGMSACGIGTGDELVTQPNSYIASAAAIVHLGARPVFADVLPDQNIDPGAVAAAITPRTKAIMAVHLTGRIADMAPIMELAERHGLLVIEDAAQSIGSRYRGRASGSFGHVGCFSAHPLKNLNAAGDAGFVTTNDRAVAQRIRRMRNHGLVDRSTAVEWGSVSRMDTLQAEILLMRLGRLSSVIERRRQNAALYGELLDPEHVFDPPSREIEFNTFHTFVIQVERRDHLKKYLAERGIGTAIHYPVPIHLQPAAAHLGYGPGSFPVAERQAGNILSLPINQTLTEEDIRYVAETINAIYEKNSISRLPGGANRARPIRGRTGRAAQTKL